MNLARRRRWADRIGLEIKLVNQDLDGYRDMMGDNAPVVGRIELYRKRLASLLRRVRQCPECRGSGYQISYAPRGKSWHKCFTCNGTGKI